MNNQEIKDHLVNVGLKATHPRIVILNRLMESHGHPTADQLHDSIHEEHPGISKGTVYRILDHFVEAGLVTPVATREGKKRYDAKLDQHSHIYCTNTHDIQDFENDELNALIHRFFEKREISNFKISDIKLQINGVKIDPNKKVKIV